MLKCFNVQFPEISINVLDCIVTIVWLNRTDLPSRRVLFEVSKPSIGTKVQKTEFNTVSVGADKSSFPNQFSFQKKAAKSRAENLKLNYHGQ